MLSKQQFAALRRHEWQPGFELAERHRLAAVPFVYLSLRRAAQHGRVARMLFGVR